MSFYCLIPSIQSNYHPVGCNGTENCCQFMAKILKGGFTVFAEITCSHIFTKDINHASAHSQYFNENFYCKNCLRVFSAMTGKPA